MNSFHGYTVQHKIGSGGMSTVYMGNHGTLGYPVAVKVLHPGMSGDQGFISRFEREARAASSLNHNNIVNVIDFGSENDIYFIVMQYIDGDDLGKIFHQVVTERDNAQFPLEIALPMLEEVAYGLKAAHQQGIIHRDIKPSNVMLSKTGDVKLADFGLARDVSDISTQASLDLTLPGTVVGTPSYMSPEQAVGGKVDARTDIFSLGVMAYQLIIGKKPFIGSSPLDVQEQIINSVLPPLSEKNCPRFTVEIDHLLTKMLAKDPTNRFQDMDQVLRALLAAQESIDLSGGIIKYKREYLARFAESTVGFAEELRKMAINGYLKRGFYFKNMGLSSISDAVREFSFALSLDASNKKAKSALKELKKQAEESGVSLTAKKISPEYGVGSPGSDITQVLPPGVVLPGQRPDSQQDSGEQPTADTPEQTMVIPGPSTVEESSSRTPVAAKSPKRPLMFVGLAVVLAVVVGLFVLRPWEGGREADQIDPVVVDVEKEEPAVPAPGPDLTENVSVENVESERSPKEAESAKADMKEARGKVSSSASQDFPEVKSLRDQAKSAADRASEAMADKLYDDAKSGFEKSTELYILAADKLKEKQDESEKALKTAEQQVTGLKKMADTASDRMAEEKTKADNAGSKTSAPKLYKQATDKEEEAGIRYGAGGEKGFRDAEKLYGEAAEFYKKANAESVVVAGRAIAQEESDAAAAQGKMVAAKDELASYSNDLLESSADFGEAQISEGEGVQAYESGKFSLATKKFNNAENSYVTAKSEIEPLQKERERREAKAAIKKTVEAFFMSIEDRDFNKVNSILKLSDDRAERWHDALENFVSLEGQSQKIDLHNDNTATVELSAMCKYKDRGATVEFKIDHTWDMRLSEGKWATINVHRK